MFLSLERKWPLPVVWSPAGPVLGASVGPDLLSQSNSSSAPCIQMHRASSKEQPQADRAENSLIISQLSFQMLSPVGFNKADISLSTLPPLPSHKFTCSTDENLFTWWFVGFFTVQERDIIHSNNVMSSSSVHLSHIIRAAEPNLRTEMMMMITLMLLKD